MATVALTTPSTSTSAATETVQVQVPTQSVRATNGGIVTLPFNRFGLFDTKPFAREMLFFPPNPTGDLIENNYDSMPPNSSEDTIITHIGARMTSFALRSYDGAVGGGAAVPANAIDPAAILNALYGGLLVVEAGATREHLIEDSLARFFDFDKADVRTVDGITTATMPTSQNLVPLKEAVVIPKGLTYKLRVILPDFVPVPTAAAYTGSKQAPLRVRIDAEHRGNR